MIWVKTESGKLVNLSGVQGISVYRDWEGVWWLMLQGISPWWFGGGWLGPYTTEQEAEVSQRRIERTFKSGVTLPTLVDFSSQEKER